MLASDYMHFVAEMERIERILKPPENYSRADYWELLRDLSLPAFKAQLSRHLQRSKFWPKPAELRGPQESASSPVQFSNDARQSTHMMLRELAQKDPARNGSLNHALDANERVWKDFLRADPELAQIELRMAQYGLIIARDGLDTPQYAEAVVEERRNRENRTRLLEDRAKALPARSWR